MPKIAAPNYLLYNSVMLERQTIISTSLINLLKNTEMPLSVAQILEQLQSESISPNKTTVYRILDKLVKKNMVTEIMLRNGVSYYEITQKHHHHFVCTQCEIVFCLASSCHLESNKVNLKQLLPTKQFKIESHDFNLYGTCETCVDK